MIDSTTVTKTHSWGSRLKSAISGLLFWPICIIIGCTLLWFNEGRSVQMIEGISEGRKTVVHIPSTPLNPLYDGKLVHVNGSASTTGVLVDEETGLSARALVISRNVEAYQWREKEDSNTQNNMWGSQTVTTTYTYEKVWDDDKIDSSEFYTLSGHTNPSSWKYEPRRFLAERVQFGAFQLSSPLIQDIPALDALSLSDVGIRVSTGETLFPQMLYVGKDSNQSEIWDLRVKYTIARSPSDLSIIAQQNGGVLTGYQAKSGAAIDRVSPGTLSSDEMFSQMEHENTLITWLMRLGGLVLIFIGASWFLSILPMLAMVIPALGAVVSFGTGLIALLVTVLLGGGTIVIAWFAHRPVVSLIVGALSALIAYGVVQLMRKKQQAASASLPSAGVEHLMEKVVETSSEQDFQKMREVSEK